MRIRLHPSGILTLAAAGMIAACAGTTTTGGTRPATASSGWVATWAPSQSSTAARPVAGTPDRVPTYANATIRQIVHTTVGGDQVRLRISNEYGDRPIVIAAARIARQANGSTIDEATTKAVTFGGQGSVVVRTGSVMVSDAIPFDVPPLTNLAISFFLPDSARTTTRHALAVQTTYVSKAGDLTAARTFAADTTMRSWLFLSGVEVHNPRVTGTIVAIGNSITDGLGSAPDSNHRWPDVLARRLLTSSEPVKAVVNAGISGNRILTFGAGPSLVSRFDRDVLLQPAVTHVIILEGINDISRDSIDVVSAEDLIFGLRQLIDRAHERGIMVYGATIMAFERHSPARQAKRQAVNQWIRSGGAFDGVVDFDAITRDPSQPNRLLPLYDSGDGLHPSDAGYRAMGEAIPLSLFRATRKP